MLGPRQHLCSLQKHVLEPVRNAEKIAERERTEISRERDAFEAFVDRAGALSPSSAEMLTLPEVTVLDEPESTDRAELRQAYRDTVMAVLHYEEVYGVSLVANVTAELGVEIATLFDTAESSS